jgi:hypothetical protein
MQHRFKTESGEYLAVAVPEISYLFSTEIDKSEDWYTLVYMMDNDDVDSGFFGDNTEYTVKIPEGNWEIIGHYPGLTEEQAAGIVDRDAYGGSPLKWYRNYKDRLPPSHATALESFASLMEAENITNNVIILKLI